MTCRESARPAANSPERWLLVLRWSPRTVCCRLRPCERPARDSRRCGSAPGRRPPCESLAKMAAPPANRQRRTSVPLPPCRSCSPQPRGQRSCPPDKTARAIACRASARDWGRTRNRGSEPDSRPRQRQCRPFQACRDMNRPRCARTSGKKRKRLARTVPARRWWTKSRLAAASGCCWQRMDWQSSRASARWRWPGLPGQAPAWRRRGCRS